MKHRMESRFAGLARVWMGSCLAVGTLAMLSACGGGGGGASTPTPPPPDPPIADAIVQAAAKAEVRAYSTPSTNKASLTWVDFIDGETGFRIDKSANGAWTQVATQPASTTNPANMSWNGSLDATATSYRVVALLAGGKEIVLKSASGATELKLGPAPTGAAIAIDQAEPVKGDVKVSLAGVPDAVSAGFYTDLSDSPLPVSATKPTFQTTWNTEPATNGSHKLRSLLQYAPDTFVEIQRTVMVGNTDFTATVRGSINAAAPTFAVYVVPSSRSDTPAASASLSVDGKPVGSTTRLDCVYFDVYNSCTPAFTFTLPTADYSLGNHDLLATATDTKGQQAQATGTIYKALPVTITLTSPQQSRFTGSAVQVRGEVAGDATYAPVTTDAVLYCPTGNSSSTQLRTGYGTFSADFDLTGLPDAACTVIVTAKFGPSYGFSVQTTRTVLWQSKPSMTYEWLADLPDAVGGINAAGTAGVVVTSGANGVSADWLMPGSTPSSVRLSTGNAYNDFRFAGNQVLGRSVDNATLYAWKADGSRQAVSSGPTAGYDTSGTQVGWLQDSGGQPTLWLTDLATPATPTAVPLSGNPAAIQYLGMALGTGAAGKPVVAYGEKLLNAQGQATGSAVFVYDAAGNTHRKVSDPATVASQPMTDGKMVAWTVAPDGVSATELWVAPVDGSSAPMRLTTSLYVSPGAARLADGLLAWTESAGDGVMNVKVYRNGTTTSLLTQRGAGVSAIGGGAVAYRGGTTTGTSRLLVWSPDKGERLVHDVGDNGSLLTNGWIYFSVGNFPTVYRAPL